MSIMCSIYFWMANMQQQLAIQQTIRSTSVRSWCGVSRSIFAYSCTKLRSGLSLAAIEAMPHENHLQVHSRGTGGGTEIWLGGGEGGGAGVRGCKAADYPREAKEKGRGKQGGDAFITIVLLRLGTSRTLRGINSQKQKNCIWNHHCYIYLHIYIGSVHIWNF